MQNMVKNIIKIIIKKLLTNVKFVGRRKCMLMLLSLVLFLLVVWPTLWPSTVKIGRTLRLQHGKNRNLEHYLQNIRFLIQPTFSACSNLDEVPVVILVASSSGRHAQREMVRKTWGRYQPTYFVMGKYTNRRKQMVINRREGGEYDDIIMYDFHDQNQNQTLKTALMMKWTLERCPKAQFMMKTKDDVMVNPWMLDHVLWENIHYPLVGYSLTVKYLQRDGKGNIRQGLGDDRLIKYLSDTGYLIRGDYIEKILTKAQQVPMVNLEDVYFTYLVAHKELGFTLTHDSRLSPYKPWLKLACVYWNLATIHSLTPVEMRDAWTSILDMVQTSNDPITICKFFNSYFGLFRNLVLYEG